MMTKKYKLIEIDHTPIIREGGTVIPLFMDEYGNTISRSICKPGFVPTGQNETTGETGPLTDSSTLKPSERKKFEKTLNEMLAQWDAEHPNV
jgi:hypothetical protein